MIDILKGLAVLVGAGIAIAAVFGIVSLFIALLPGIILVATYFLGGVLSVAIIIGVIAAIIYVAKEVGKAM